LGFNSQLIQLANKSTNNIDQHINIAAQKSRLKVSELMSCINDKRFQQRINSDQKETQTLGFTGTLGLVFIKNKTNKTIIKQGALNLKNLTMLSNKIANQ
jgi:hypothetical protein